MGPMRSRFYSLALTMVLVLLPGMVWSKQLPASQGWEQCLKCHAAPGITVVFRDGDRMSASIDPRALQRSVHGGLSCSGCHADFSAATHPVRTFRSRLHYQIRSSMVCRRCHSNLQIKKHPIHRKLLQEEQKGDPLVCVNCHGAHAIARVSGRNAFSSEEQYCMTCHDRDQTLKFGSGETKRLKIDISRLHVSVHARLTCSDCHFGFSSEEHPRRTFRTSRDFVLAAAESCRRCHFDKYTRTLESIHYALLSQGRMNAPVCTDCHGSHDISRIGNERTASARRCQRCHAKEYEVYAESIHGNALFNEHNQDVPVCVDCHTAHDIQDPFSSDYRERIPEICSNCHGRKEIVGKYGLSTDVVTSYLSDFHGVTLGLYKLQKDDAFRPTRPIAVCTDCHGTHNITGTLGPDSAGVKKNLIRRCQKCHPDANEHFPDAWLSHYEPSFRRAPLVFAVTVLYKLFIPIILIGLILQILLHIWRYAVNR